MEAGDVEFADIVLDWTLCVLEIPLASIQLELRICIRLPPCQGWPHIRNRKSSTGATVGVVPAC